MVGSHHRMINVVPLSFDAVWEHLRNDRKLSAVNDSGVLFSFQFRSKASSTVKALVGGAYLAVGILKPDAKRLEAPPPTWNQAPLDAVERREVCRLFDNDLLQGRLPTGFMLVAREPFDAANERAYAEAQPDLYRYVMDKGFVSYLHSIRNLGRLSPAQETLLRRQRAKDARKQMHVVPGGEPTKAEQDKALAQAEQERLRYRRRNDPDGIPDGEPDF